MLVDLQRANELFPFRNQDSAKTLVSFASTYLPSLLLELAAGVEQSIVVVTAVGTVTLR